MTFSDQFSWLMIVVILFFFTLTFVASGDNWWYNNTGLDNGMAPIKRQANICANDDLV